MKVDKLREVKDGHDGTWVAHPALVTLAKEIFDEHMPQPNQIDKKREDVKTTRESLLEVSAPGRVTPKATGCSSSWSGASHKRWLNAQGRHAPLPVSVACPYSTGALVLYNLDGPQSLWHKRGRGSVRTQ